MHARMHVCKSRASHVWRRGCKSPFASLANRLARETRKGMVLFQHARCSLAGSRMCSETWREYGTSWGGWSDWPGMVDAISSGGPAELTSMAWTLTSFSSSRRLHGVCGWASEWHGGGKNFTKTVCIVLNPQGNTSRCFASSSTAHHKG